MLRLLLALLVCGALIWWLLPARESGNPADGRVQAMLRTLQENGCGPDSGAVASAGGERASLAILSKAIEDCEARAARRDAGDAVRP